MNDTIVTIIGGIIVAIITVGGGALGSWLVVIGARKKTQAEAAQSNAEAQKALEEAKKLKLEAEAIQASMASKQDEAEREAQDRIKAYWKEYAGNLEGLVKTQGDNIALLQKRDNDREQQMRQAKNAFEYLCHEVERDYSSAVKIAREIFNGTTIRNEGKSQ
jgi:hypothetical protein